MTNLTITTGGRERVGDASSIFADAFRNDPVITYILSRLSTKERHEYLYKYFTCLFTAAGLNRATFNSTEADGQSTAYSVLMPPGTHVDNPWTLLPAGMIGMLWKIGFRGVYKMLFEFEPRTDAAKAKGLKSRRDFWYIFGVATDASHRGKGLCSALLRKAQEEARAEGVPLWLEATTEYSSKLYASLGFESVERIVLGRGSAAADGTPLKGGDGVPIVAMVWWPDQ